MNAVLAITFLMVVYMIGEIVVLKTKATLSSTFVIAIVMLISFIFTMQHVGLTIVALM